MFKLHGAVATATLMAMASFANAQWSSSAPSPGSETIVLVHGAFVDGSGWQKVYDLLTNDGYQVIVTQNSNASLNGDVATVNATSSRRTVILFVRFWRHPDSLRVHPESSFGFTEFSDHQANGRPAQERETGTVQTLPVLG